MNPVKRAANLITSGLNFCRSTTAKGTAQSPAAPKSCELQGQVYLHGSEIMHGAMIRRCVDGEWQERVNPFITVGP